MFAIASVSLQFSNSRSLKTGNQQTTGCTTQVKIQIRTSNYLINRTRKNKKKQESFDGLQCDYIRVGAKYDYVRESENKNHFSYLFCVPLLFTND